MEELETDKMEFEAMCKLDDNCATPQKTAKQIIDLFPLKEDDKVLDAFSGEGVFYDNYPRFVKKDWCEIKRGRDFFAYDEPVDWIITNPPYSMFDEVLDHSFEIADNIVYLVPLWKIFESLKSFRKIMKYGNIKKIYMINGAKCGYITNKPACAIWLQKGYMGLTDIKEL